MLFNSLAFALFLPLVFALHWMLGRGGVRTQNLLLITAGFVFYGWWDWRFLLLLIATSSTDYFVALGLGRTEGPSRRKWLLAISVIGNLGTLAVFKYYDFFARSFAAAFGHFGITFSPTLLHVVLPVGISFYTFQALSYTIDVYRRRITPERDLSVFMAFIAFFPQLLAGPIERAGHMLPQFSRKRTFDQALATDGLRQMLWGFFKKAVIADNCAPVVAKIFAHPEYFTASTLWLGAVLFAFQIYGDFSGYSDIAIGSARLFGLELRRNFAFPYFSRDIAEFWRRWHMSLTAWFRDYVFIPLGGSRNGRVTQLRNVILVFLLSGFWHGANWTFLAWGGVHALLYVGFLLINGGKAERNTADTRVITGIRDLLGIALTFACTTIAWVFFRAERITDAVHYIRGMFSSGLFAPSKLFDPWVAGLIGVLVLAEWLQRSEQHALQVVRLKPVARRSIYFGVFLLIFFFGRFEGHEFIYFQF